MAYALSWPRLQVALGDAALGAGAVPRGFKDVRCLRDTGCGDAGCAWCAEMNDPRRALQRWFGFPAFRPTLVDASGALLQEGVGSTATETHWWCEPAAGKRRDSTLHRRSPNKNKK
ncbi:hypothetical protein FAZ78_19120 [Cereibacter changlensis]|uniref:Uncharacterized protein n=1 Tax=Cereibacter changlensis TaxID=402884 RepID=A0A4U0YYH5_9RHOB|nr:hypothetical protein [Cereibacter changlensis]TKA95011.1 hypothetical protein FAZ78_19120 [Cereibacter changlensis]